MMRIAGVAAILLLLCPGFANAQDRTGAAVLRAGDVLRVAVWPETNLSGDFPIESSGEIYLPLIGAVAVVGRPLQEVRLDLRNRYRAVIENAVVMATPLFRVSVIGAVQRPDLYQVDPTHTVFDLVSMAGGFTQEAKLDAIRLIRGDSVIELNAAGALDTGDAALSLPLLSGDRLFVPERPNRSRRLQAIWSGVQAVALLATLAIQIF